MDSLFAAGAAAALTSSAASAYKDDSAPDDTKRTGMVAPDKAKKGSKSADGASAVQAEKERPARATDSDE